MLNNDTIIRGVVYDMRDALSDSIDGLTGKYTSAASIGITTTSYTEKGKIQLDENKLRNVASKDKKIKEAYEICKNKLCKKYEERIFKLEKESK